MLKGKKHLYFESNNLNAMRDGFQMVNDESGQDIPTEIPCQRLPVLAKVEINSTKYLHL